MWNFLRVFRGAHQQYLSHYVVTFETMSNVKRFTAAILQQMCFYQLRP